MTWPTLTDNKMTFCAYNTSKSTLHLKYTFLMPIPAVLYSIFSCSTCKTIWVSILKLNYDNLMNPNSNTISKSYAKSEFLIQLTLATLSIDAGTVIELQKLLNWNMLTSCFFFPPQLIELTHMPNLSNCKNSWKESSSTQLNLNQNLTEIRRNFSRMPLYLSHLPILRITRYLPPIIISERLSFNSRIFSMLIELCLFSICEGRSFRCWR